MGEYAEYVENATADPDFGGLADHLQFLAESGEAVDDAGILYGGHFGAEDVLMGGYIGSEGILEGGHCGLLEGTDICEQAWPEMQEELPPPQQALEPPRRVRHNPIICKFFL